MNSVPHSTTIEFEFAEIIIHTDAFVVENDLFHVVYNGSKPAEVWIEHDSKTVTFVARGKPTESADAPHS